MSIYSIDGTAMTGAFGVDGDNLSACYDIDGETVWTAESTTLKVMAYNVGGWYTGSGSNVPADKKSEYLALQTGMIEDNDPDILIIQEYLANFSADGTSALSMLQSLFPYVHVKTSGTYFGRAICSKYPITDYTERTYSVETSRYYDSCTITVDGTPITVCTTHLSVSSEANRTAQIEQLIPFLQQQARFIVGGDFNTGIIDSTANTESAAYISAVKPFIDAEFNTANFVNDEFLVTCNDGVDGAGRNWYLDNLYTSDNMTISNVYVDTTKLTDNINEKVDHMPLIATVTIS